jgi:glutaconate CoA-transferase subunit B
MSIDTAAGQDYAVDELRACVISRDFEDGERVFLGANVNIGRAAVLLAHRLRAPNMKVMLGLSWTNMIDEREVGLHPDSTDFRDARWAEAYVNLDTMINSYRFFSTTFVISALQIDRFGNSNLIGIGEDHKKLKLRGPGAIGSVSSTAYCDRFYITPPRHVKEIFVPKCDFISSVGWGEGGPTARTDLGLPGGGPRLCVTPLCVFDFETADKSMRLLSVHPGHSVDEVVENTDFEFEIPSEVLETEPPRPEELELLRTSIDTNGLLREAG